MFSVEYTKPASSQSTIITSSAELSPANTVATSVPSTPQNVLVEKPKRVRRFAKGVHKCTHQVNLRFSELNLPNDRFATVNSFEQKLTKSF